MKSAHYGEKYRTTSREYLTLVEDIREGFSEKVASRPSTEG